MNGRNAFNMNAPAFEEIQVHIATCTLRSWLIYCTSMGQYMLLSVRVKTCEDKLKSLLKQQFNKIEVLPTLALLIHGKQQ